MSKTICCVAGRSGGHIIPCLTYVQHLQEKNPQTSILFFSTHNTLDASILKSFPTITDHVALPFDGLPTKRNIFPWLGVIQQLCISSIKIIYKLIMQRPSVIISTGGYIAVPVCFIGYILRIPIELFELNAIPGKATLFLARYATIIHTCFPEAQSYFKRHKTDVIPYPVRFSTKSIPSRQEAEMHMGFDAAKKTLLILGGSQGSHFINKLLQEACKEYPTFFKSLQIIHQTGEQAQDIKAFYTAKNITSCVFSYTPGMELFYPAADIVICRAGAGTLFETLYFKKKALIIPLETHTTDHQVDNALSLCKQYPDLFKLIYQRDLTLDKDLFIQQLQQMLDSM